MLVAGGPIRTIDYRRRRCALAPILSLFVLGCPLVTEMSGAELGRSLFNRSSSHSSGPYAQRQAVIAGLPTGRLTRQAQQQILSIVNSPTLYRRLPTQAIDCDRDMFLFLARNPEVMVGIWDLMGITNVQTRRTGPFQLKAQDGSGTACDIDLVYGDPSLHIFVAQGSYDGKLAALPIGGKGVFILRSSYAVGSGGHTTVTGTIDCFVQVDSLGVDLVARTLSGLIGRSADRNFEETARFIGQVSQVSERNPPAMVDVAERMPQVDAKTKQQFIDLINTVALRAAGTDRVVSHLQRSSR